jgi:hypothetical protein
VLTPILTRHCEWCCRCRAAAAEQGEQQGPAEAWARATKYRTFFRRIAVGYPAASLFARGAAASEELASLVQGADISMRLKTWMAQCFPALHDLVAALSFTSLPGCVCDLVADIAQRVVNPPVNHVRPTNHVFVLLPVCTASTAAVAGACACHCCCACHRSTCQQCCVQLRLVDRV